MDNTKKSSGSSRVGILDELRGFAIICMVVYHAMYDLKYLFGLDIPIFFDGWFDVIRDIFAGLFIFISVSYTHLDVYKRQRRLVPYSLVNLLCGKHPSRVRHQQLNYAVLLRRELHRLAVNVELTLIAVQQQTSKRNIAAAGTVRIVAQGHIAP